MKAICLGSAECLWDDLAEVDTEGVTVIACNWAGVHYPGRLHHWVTLHPEKYRIWQPKRAGNRDYTAWADVKTDRVDRVIDAWGGSSGMLTVQVAREQLGATRITLCGIPIGPQAHFHGEATWGAWENYRPTWEAMYEELAPYVRSLSGWTRELFGPPEAGWPGAEFDRRTVGT